MLRIVESTTMTGTITIDGTEVASVTANIVNGVASNVNKYIYSEELYNANKKEIRKDIADFTAAAYAEEDSQKTK